MAAVTTIENNTVSIAGEVVSECVFSHKIYGEGFYRFEILASRLSENADTLPVTVSERLLGNEDLKVGMHVCVKGQLRSYNSYHEKRNKLILTIFAREITIEKEEIPKDHNQVFLDGFLCKEPIYRVTPFGREITDILLAVNRAYNKSDYIPCIAWGRNARFSGTLGVGSHIRLWGRMQSRKYQKKQADTVEERVAYEVSVSRIEIEPSAIEETKEEEN